MIDYFDAILFGIQDAAQAVNSSVVVSEPYNHKDSQFPFVGVSETNNTTVSIDSAQREKYAAVSYQIRVMSNKETGKRQEAMQIFQAVDEWLVNHNFIRKNRLTTPNLYLTSVYEITANYEAVIDETGNIYTRG